MPRRASEPFLKHRRRYPPATFRKIEEAGPGISRQPTGEAEARIHAEARAAFPGTDLEPFWDLGQWWLRDLKDPKRKQWAVEDVGPDEAGVVKFVEVR